MLGMCFDRAKRLHLLLSGTLEFLFTNPQLTQVDPTQLEDSFAEITVRPLYIHILCAQFGVDIPRNLASQRLELTKEYFWEVRLPQRVVCAIPCSRSCSNSRASAYAPILSHSVKRMARCCMPFGHAALSTWYGFWRSTPRIDTYLSRSEKAGV